MPLLWLLWSVSWVVGAVVGAAVLVRVVVSCLRWLRLDLGWRVCVRAWCAFVRASIGFDPAAWLKATVSCC